MMQFRTELILPSSPLQLRLGDPVFTIGSCFSDVMGQRLLETKLPVLVNPFGTIFNPLSQFQLVQAALMPGMAEEFSFTENNGRWNAFELHSRFSASTREELEELIDVTLEEVRLHLQKTKVLVFTFGTAYVFEHTDTGRLVANCHKLPQQQFTRRLLQTEEIISSFAETHALLRQLNPELEVVLTVSPVRHLKDTIPLNSVSKSVLRLATHHICDLLQGVHYFPGYELVVDDLRDYRFYKDDLLHPSGMAEDYIWEKFTEAYFGPELRDFAAEWNKLRQAIAHRPFQPESAAHQEFLQRTLDRLEVLSEKADFRPEIARLRSQLTSDRPVSYKRKASPELLALLESVATSEVMNEESSFTQSAPAQAQNAYDAAESFWPSEEEPAAPAQASESALPDQENARPVLPARTREDRKKKKKRNKKDSLREATEAAAIAQETSLPAAGPPVTTAETAGQASQQTEGATAALPGGISKSKKRREKRKAKRLALQHPQSQLPMDF